MRSGQDTLGSVQGMLDNEAAGRRARVEMRKCFLLQRRPSRLRPLEYRRFCLASDLHFNAVEARLPRERQTAVWRHLCRS
jgi:hypothetical protein